MEQTHLLTMPRGSLGTSLPVNVKLLHGGVAYWVRNWTRASEVQGSILRNS
uniref:Uncharacterized protein n=1 Tax=Anguilla anguilla TaxID=7936 RepID=A0A0E9Q3Y1_ANGAN